MKRLIICWLILLMLGATLDAEEGSDSTPKLTNPQATAETKALYRNLYEMAKEGVLFGNFTSTTATGSGLAKCRQAPKLRRLASQGRFHLSCIPARLRLSLYYCDIIYLIES
jgi:hypothetical protein